MKKYLLFVLIGFALTSSLGYADSIDKKRSVFLIRSGSDMQTFFQARTDKPLPYNEFAKYYDWEVATAKNEFERRKIVKEKEESTEYDYIHEDLVGICKFLRIRRKLLLINFQKTERSILMFLLFLRGYTFTSTSMSTYEP